MSNRQKAFTCRVCLRRRKNKQQHKNHIQINLAKTTGTFATLRKINKNKNEYGLQICNYVGLWMYLHTYTYVHIYINVSFLMLHSNTRAYNSFIHPFIWSSSIMCTRMCTQVYDYEYCLQFIYYQHNIHKSIHPSIQPQAVVVHSSLIHSFMPRESLTKTITITNGYMNFASNSHLVATHLLGTVCVFFFGAKKIQAA